MHNKASYKYILEARAQEKRSYDHLNENKFGAKGAKVLAARSASFSAAPHALDLFAAVVAVFQGAKGSKYDPDDVAEDKGAKADGSGGGGSKAAAKDDDDVWSKEADYY